MAATGGEAASRTHEYEVFLSFRGPDTRYSFTDCLYEELVGNGLVVFRDSEDLHFGEKIDELLEAVTNSRICIPILSNGYASSAWCLRELELMSEPKESTGSSEILPIFFDVTPYDVKAKTGPYFDALKKHKERHSDDQVGRWKAALEKVAEIRGWEAQKQGHGKLIKTVVGEVLRKLKKKEKKVIDMVGIDGKVEAVIKMLDVNSQGVRFVGIYGLGGIGKTTLAKLIYNKLCSDFQKCSFVDDVQESSKNNGLVNLQKKMLRDLHNSNQVNDNIADIDEGRRRIHRIVGSNKRVLIVLDNINKKGHLEDLVGCPDSLGSGCRVLITTRDKGTLAHVNGILTYKVMKLNSEKALKLFRMHAFGSYHPSNAYHSLSKQVVSKIGGLPLTLKVIGSHLREQNSMEIWKETLNRLSETTPDEVLHQLRISYDALHDNEKYIFLDIACHFMNKSKTIAINAWEACGLYPRAGIQILAEKSLIIVTLLGTISMHDELRNLARKIVCEESLVDVTGRSRFWNSEKALDIVRSKKTKDKVEALSLVKAQRSEPIFITDEELDKFPNLKFLELTGGTFVGDFSGHISKLKCFYWHYPPLGCRLTNFHFKDLVRFELSNCEATENWGGWSLLKMANRLKVLVLWGCHGLTRTPDFSGCLTLEKLSLRKCPKVQTIDSSIGRLKELISLEIHGCENLRRLPDEIEGLVKLQYLSLMECYRLVELPYSIGTLASLSEFIIRFQEIKRLPNSIGKAKELSVLNLSWTLIDELPYSIGELKGLESLSLKGCKCLRELPKSIGNLRSLKKLNVSHTKIVELPTTIGGLQRLEELHAYNCEVLKQLPAEISGLSSLRIIDLSNTCIDVVPSTVILLANLKELDLTDCNELRGLPDLPPSLNFLYVKSSSLQLIPDLLNLTNLVDLLISDGSRKARVRAPDSNPVSTPTVQWIGRSSMLKKLELNLSVILSPSAQPCCLPQLRHLILSGVDMRLPEHLLSCPSESLLDSIISTTPNLKRLDLFCILLNEIRLDGLVMLRYLTVKHCELLKGLSISSSLRKLKEIKVTGCPMLVKIEILGELKSLEILSVDRCASLERLHDVMEQVTLFVRGCNKLRDTGQSGWEVRMPLQRKFGELYETKNYDFLGSLGVLSEISLNTPDEPWICDHLYDERNPGFWMYDRLNELKMSGRLCASDYGKLEGLLDVPSTKIADRSKVNLRKCLKLIESCSHIPEALRMEMMLFGLTGPEVETLTEDQDTKEEEDLEVFEWLCDEGQSNVEIKFTVDDDDETEKMDNQEDSPMIQNVKQKGCPRQLKPRELVAFFVLSFCSLVLFFIATNSLSGFSAYDELFLIFFWSIVWALFLCWLSIK